MMPPADELCSALLMHDCLALLRAHKAGDTEAVDKLTAEYEGYLIQLIDGLAEVALLVLPGDEAEQDAWIDAAEGVFSVVLLDAEAEGWEGEIPDE